jgi:hypothetical protein
MCVSTVSSTGSNGIDGIAGSATGRGEEKMPRSTTGIVYGLGNGGLGYLLMNRDGQYGSAWCVNDGPSNALGGLENMSVGETMKSSINCLTICDLTKDGMNEIVVGRDDGRIEVFSQFVSVFHFIV